jgi:hypothetical protein
VNETNTRYISLFVAELEYQFRKQGKWLWIIKL